MTAGPLGSAMATRSPRRIPAPAKASAAALTWRRSDSYVMHAPVSGITRATLLPGVACSRSSSVAGKEVSVIWLEIGW